MTSRRSRTASIALPALVVVVGLALGGCTLQVTDPLSSGSSNQPSTSRATTAPSVGGTSTQNCEDQSLVIAAGTVSALLSGDCNDITVDAEGATVTLDDADSVTVTADGVVVIVNGSIDDVRLQGNDGSVTSTGIDNLVIEGDTNTVTATDIDDINVTGSANTVAWSQGDGLVTDTGAGNTLIGPN